MNEMKLTVKREIKDQNHISFPRAIAALDV